MSTTPTFEQENDFSIASPRTPNIVALRELEMAGGNGPNFNYYSENPISNNIGWLKKKFNQQILREHSEQTNWMFNWKTEAVENLGPVTVSWAARFSMPDHATSNEWTPLRDITDETKIPLQAYQMANELWSTGFHVTYTLSLSGHDLNLLIGLPYKTLLEEAELMGMVFRLGWTKGTVRFQDELLPRYPTSLSDDETCFSSAHKQGLTLFRMKRVPVVIPAVAASLLPAAKYHKQIKRQHLKGVPIRSYKLIRWMKSFGAYRPHSFDIFGATVTRVAKEIKENPWLVVRQDDTSFTDGDNVSADHLLDRAAQLAGGTKVTHEQLGYVIGVFDDWTAKQTENGIIERFDGQFESFFALHEKQKLQQLRDEWSSFKFLFRFKWEAKSPEWATDVAYYHPDNEPVVQFGLLYQPLDEVRDYFGDHIALYFAWLGHYTRALIFPTVFGAAGMVSQALSPSMDENPLTIPYSVFFAMWSVTFLSSWNQKSNELGYLWGSEGFEANERTRPQFKGVHKVNLETGREVMLHDHLVLRYLKLALSFGISFSCISLTIIFAVEATAVQSWGIPECGGLNAYELSKQTATDASSGADFCDSNPLMKNRFKFLSSLLNLVLIFASGTIYEKVAENLTEWENHRTETDWADSKIIKNFLFQFINNYFVLFYLAYIRPFREPITRTPFESTSNVLQFQLMVVFTGKTLAKTVADVVKPWLARRSGINKIVKTMAADGSAETSLLGNMVNVVGDLKDNLQEKVVDLAEKFEDAAPIAQLGQSETQIEQAGEDHVPTMGTETAAERRDAQLKKDRDDSMKLQAIEAGETGSVADKDGDGVLTIEEIDADGDGILTAEELGVADGGSASPGRHVAEEIVPTDTHNIPTFAGKTNEELKALFLELSERPDSIEDEVILEEFVSTFSEFNDATIQYGYLAIFAPAYPLAPLFAFLKNVFDIRNDATAYTHNMRRPQWKQCEDIGAWFGVMNVIGFFAVITNATMVCFVGSQMAAEGLDAQGQDEKEGIWVRAYSQRLWLLSIIAEHVVMLMRVVIAKFSPEMPAWVDDARDILRYRTEQWQDGIVSARALGKNLEEIQVMLGNDKTPKIVRTDTNIAAAGASKIFSLGKSLLNIESHPSITYVKEDKADDMLDDEALNDSMADKLQKEQAAQAKRQMSQEKANAQTDSDDT